MIPLPRSYVKYACSDLDTSLKEDITTEFMYNFALPTDKKLALFYPLKSTKQEFQGDR